MQRVLLLMDDPRLRPRYVRLLRRRGHSVHSTRDPQQVWALLQQNQFSLAIIDSDIDDEDIQSYIQQWSALTARPPLVILSTPTTRSLSESAAFRFPIPKGVDLILHKPLSPMEFGIQVDHFLGETGGDTDSSTLEESSEAQREFGVMQKEFILQLDEDISRIEQCWRDLTAHETNSSSHARRLKRTLSPIRAAANHFGFLELGEDIESLENFIAPLITSPDSKNSARIPRGEILISLIADHCRSLQIDNLDELPDGQQSHFQTLLVIDPDVQYLRTLEEWGDQFMIRVRSARCLDEALSRARTPLMTGVVMTVSSETTASELATSIEKLQAASHRSPLPIALVCESESDRNEIRNLWAGASMLVAKPLTALTFARLSERLASLRRAQKSTILVIEPDDDFATFLCATLDDRNTTVRAHDPNFSLFEELETHRPDLLVVNAHFSGLSSFDLCRTIRAIPRWQDMPIIMTTHRQQRETRIAAYQAGADDFLSTDINTEELRARVQVRLQRARTLKERTDRDMLTGLLTRRAFLEQLAARISEVARKNRTLAFCILDVDHFKTVNDTHGHPAGDRVLRTLGRLLRDRFRIEDLRGRWGGEEFTIVLVDEDARAAKQALDRVRNEFSQIPFMNQYDRPFYVTFSAGVADFPADGHDVETLLHAADSRLLRAKRSGRNTILLSGTSPSP